MIHRPPNLPPVERPAPRYQGAITDACTHQEHDTHTKDTGAARFGPPSPTGATSWPVPPGAGDGPGTGPGRPDGFGRHGGFGPGFGRGRKARRGDVRAAILALLAEEPMHGYQIITELIERSGGVWRPSPGSVYPTLSALEDQGLVTADTSEGRRVFHSPPRVGPRRRRPATVPPPGRRLPAATDRSPT